MFIPYYLSEITEKREKREKANGIILS